MRRRSLHCERKGVVGPMDTAARAGGSSSRFPLVDRYTGIRLGVDLATVEPGTTAVVESARRLKPELSYGFVHILWWVWLEDGRSVMSVPPGVAGAGRAIAGTVHSRAELLDPATAERLREHIDPALGRLGLPRTNRVFRDLTFTFACCGAVLHRHTAAECLRLRDSTVPPADGLRLPAHCFPDGVAYGVIADGRVASVAYAHRAGVLEDRVADVGVETAPDYRGRGYAKTAVSALVAHFAATGGEARYACDPANTPSVRAAAAVGFVPYATSLILAGAPPTS